MYFAWQVSVDNLVQLIGVMDKHLLDTANLSLTPATVSCLRVHQVAWCLYRTAGCYTQGHAYTHWSWMQGWEEGKDISPHSTSTPPPMSI